MKSGASIPEVLARKSRSRAHHERAGHQPFQRDRIVRAPITCRNFSFVLSAGSSKPYIATPQSMQLIVSFADPHAVLYRTFLVRPRDPDPSAVFNAMLGIARFI
jgi:hypothetical protein